MILSLILSLSFVLNLNSAPKYTSPSLYNNFLKSEKASVEVYKNFEGFVSNVVNYVKDENKIKKEFPKYSVKELRKILGRIHNTMINTIYSCSTKKPKAKTFSEAIDGKHTPDSNHYAALIHSAFQMLTGVKTEFFKTPSHYGLFYRDEKTGEELYWCIIVSASNKLAPQTMKEYITLFNKNKNPEINGKEDLLAKDVNIISAKDFYSINSNII
jgi:hypothetical protein